ncbi:hypothetical protein [Elongatibacter sediminis]|uniref:Uncharacterized protein n=1 Tax=Elongatibacter sediminis TaxID=3119006 RepID=A0AAW9R647_9GAMM
MLTKSVMDTAQDRVGIAAVAETVAAAHLADTTAANTAEYDRDEIQARRLRRQRRQDRAARRNLAGWTVRMW